MELNIESVTKKYGEKSAVDSLSAHLPAGIYGLLGPNGAGKTTFMRLICDLIKPTNGVISYNDKEIGKLGQDYRKILGYLPQNFGFYPDFTVNRYLEYISALKGLNPHFAKKRITILLDTVGLSDWSKTKIAKLSGGMQRRLGIAQALLNEPDLLILDEPTVGLDPSENVRFRNLISTISQNKITILSTHIVSDISCIADEILLMQDGRLQYRGSVKNLTSRVENKVWEVTVDSSKVNSVSQGFIISNIQHTSTGAVMRIVSEDKPLEHAKIVQPTLEDAYLFYVGEKGMVSV